MKKWGVKDYTMDILGVYGVANFYIGRSLPMELARDYF